MFRASSSSATIKFLHDAAVTHQQFVSDKNMLPLHGNYTMLDSAIESILLAYGCWAHPVPAVRNINQIIIIVVVFVVFLVFLILLFLLIIIIIIIIIYYLCMILEIIVLFMPQQTF